MYIYIAAAAAREREGGMGRLVRMSRTNQEVFVVNWNDTVRLAFAFSG